MSELIPQVGLLLLGQAAGDQAGVDVEVGGAGRDVDEEIHQLVPQPGLAGDGQAGKERDRVGGRLVHGPLVPDVAAQLIERMLCILARAGEQPEQSGDVGSRPVGVLHPVPGNVVEAGERAASKRHAQR